MPNYATKSNLNATGVNTLQFGKKDELANLKSEVDKLDIDKLEKLLSGLNSLKSKLDKLDIGKLAATPVDLRDAKIKDIEEKISNIIGLATTTALLRIRYQTVVL